MGLTRTLRLSVDIGGTFTDGVLVDDADGSVSTTKVLTTDPPGDGALKAADEVLASAGMSYDRVSQIVHATTLAANSVIQRKGALVGLITNKGFEDILEIAREVRYDTSRYDLPLFEPLVPRELCRGVDCRVLSDGTEYRPLAIEDVDDIIDEWAKAGVESIAVCFLHSYLNPAHEIEVAKRVWNRFGPDFPVSLSSEVAPEVREYERACTTIANAYVQPLMAGYLRRLERELADRGYNGRLHVMLSHGGVSTVETPSRFPSRMLESGPAAGVLAASHVAENIDSNLPIVALDVGGTTAKACLVVGAKPARASRFEVARRDRTRSGSGLTIQLPAIDLIEVGMGGGSIASVDSLGLLRVGPESAESRPGPACYGLGGTRPTLTDASVVLGFLGAETFGSSVLELQPELAHTAIAELGVELSQSAVTTAWAVYELATEAMADAIRVHLAEHGQDPSATTLVASGGGGPLHAALAARKLGIGRVVIPLRAGVLSAVGLLVTPPSFELVHGDAMRLDADADWERAERLMVELEQESIATIASASVHDEQPTVERSAEMRWVGQAHSLYVSLPPGPFGSHSREEFMARFDGECVRRYGGALEHTTLEVLNWKVVASARQPPSEFRALCVEPSVEKTGSREIWLPDLGYLNVSAHRRADLSPGFTISGPALVVDVDSTTFVPPGSTARLDEASSLIITILHRPSKA